MTPKTLDQLYRELAKKKGRRASTVHHSHRLLNAAFNQAMRWEMLDRNPAQLARPPRGRQKEIEPPKIDDVRKVIDAAADSQNPENALIFRMIAATGCRRAEICGLHWTDVTLDDGLVRILTSVVQVSADLYEKDTKAHQQRTVRLDATTAKMLRDHHEFVEDRADEFETDLDPAAYVFSDEIDGSTLIPPDRLTQAWRRLADSVGSNSRLHDLRHLQASILLDAGESVTTVAARLGHRNGTDIRSVATIVLHIHESASLDHCDGGENRGGPCVVAKDLRVRSPSSSARRALWIRLWTMTLPSPVLAVCRGRPAGNPSHKNVSIGPDQAALLGSATTETPGKCDWTGERGILQSAGWGAPWCRRCRRSCRPLLPTSLATGG